jgi:hypothetical protein
LEREFFEGKKAGLRLNITEIIEMAFLPILPPVPPYEGGMEIDLNRIIGLFEHYFLKGELKGVLNLL